MAANAPEVQVIFDTAYQTSIKINGYCDAPTTANNVILNPKTLSFANLQQTCLVSLNSLEFSVSANGFVQLAWEGSSANTPIYTIGKSQAGTLSGTITNNATTPTGNVVLRQMGLLPLDTYSMILTFTKTQGYANAYLNTYGTNPTTL